SVRVVVPAVAVVAGPAGDSLAGATAGLPGITAAFAGLWVLVAALAFARKRLLAGRPVGESGTWDCGYAAPTARMQYTASSFAQPLTDMVHFMLRTRRALTPPRGLFPAPGALATTTPDVCREGLYRPVFEGIAGGLMRL